MSPPAAKKLANRLKALREERGLTQEEAAKKCGIKYKYYQEHEGNRPRDVRLSTMEKLARGFGVPLAALFE